MSFPAVQFLMLLVTTALAPEPSAGLRGVRLDLPPAVRAGSSATLRCLYDLEGAQLYSVKWYRGNFEFYRAMPMEQPARQAFPYPDINVDLSASDERQVTLRRVLPHISGTFSCEVSIEGAFTTAVASGLLQVLEVRRPEVTVSKDLYSPGEELEVNCTVPSPVWTRRPRPEDPVIGAPPHQPITAEQLAILERGDSDQSPVRFAFWINSIPVPQQMVLQTSPSSASLRRELSELDFLRGGELRIKCVASVAGKNREPSHIVMVRRRDESSYTDIPVPHEPEPRHEEPQPQLDGGAAAGRSSLLQVPAGLVLTMYLMCCTLQAFTVL